jgi:hypothetical protein
LYSQVGVGETVYVDVQRDAVVLVDVGGGGVVEGLVLVVKVELPGFVEVVQVVVLDGVLEGGLVELDELDDELDELDDELDELRWFVSVLYR